MLTELRNRGVQDALIVCCDGLKGLPESIRTTFLVATQRRKNRQDMTGKITGWKSILNTLHVHYGDRIQAATN